MAAKPSVVTIDCCETERLGYGAFIFGSSTFSFDLTGFLWVVVILNLGLGPLTYAILILYYKLIYKYAPGVLGF